MLSNADGWLSAGSLTILRWVFSKALAELSGYGCEIFKVRHSVQTAGLPWH